jgi:hypothetical protein
MSAQATHEKFAKLAAEAEAQGLQCVMFTITLPRRFHPLEYGKPNPRHHGETPRDGQKWLRDGWARVRAALARRSLRVHGLRVVEPHRDATPHWHVLMFTKEAETPAVRSVVRHFMNTSDELGWVDVRVLESAATASYCVRKFVTEDSDIQMWAEVWGIRLCGFFGLADEVGAGK